VSRRRWIFLGVTALSAVAFLVDRVFFSAPAPAAAETLVRSPTPRPSKSAVAAKAGPADPELFDPSLTYLDKLPPSNFNRDIFAASPEMQKFYQKLEEKQNTDPTTKGPKPGTPAAFATKHHLQATFNSPDGAIAAVDDKMVRVGEELGGFKLTRVGPYFAEFTRENDTVTIFIPALGTKSESGDNSKSEPDTKSDNNQ